MIKLMLGDCLNSIKSLPDNSVDSIVTDPPYGIRFMGKAWDGADIEKMLERDRSEGDTKTSISMAAGKYDLSDKGMIAFQEFSYQWAKECMRVLKPGGHLLAFASCRTYHRMAVGVEMAGFEIRDQIQWLFGSGFPKSHNLKDEWQGWGTALKPANEPIVVARKPLEKGLTVAQNVLKYGTGALNIDGSRIEGLSEKELNWTPQRQSASTSIDIGGARPGQEMPMFNLKGRWPANVILDEEAANLLDLSVDDNVSRFFKICGHENTGNALRFAYVAKASKAERNKGLEGMPLVKSGSLGTGEGGGPMLTGSGNERQNLNQNFHPTVKPTKLMSYLIKLVTPLGGTVLDPFMGSGSTGVAAKELGFGFIGCEREPQYFEISQKRIGE